jgi:hypothetical protein
MTKRMGPEGYHITFQTSEGWVWWLVVIIPATLEEQIRIVV